MLRYERQHWDNGMATLAGVDEAGRGPLAGPVVAAAVVFERAFVEAEEHGLLDGLTDSKRLAESRRNTFFNILKTSRHVAIGVGRAEVEEIEQCNILCATHRAMARAVEALPSLPAHVLVDGLPVAGLPCPATVFILWGSGSNARAACSTHPTSTPQPSATATAAAAVVPMTLLPKSVPFTETEPPRYRMVPSMYR